MSATQERKLRAEFFRFLFAKRNGYVVIGTESSVKGDFRQRFFQWPVEESKLLTYVEASVKSNKNVWFGINLYGKKERSKNACLDANLLWADLDDCAPEELEIQPQVVIESSPSRWQAIWRVDEDIDPKIAEDYSRRIFSKYASNGVDSGWALTKLLRVPFTKNLKYADKPIVKLIRAHEELLPTKLFDEISKTPTGGEDFELDVSLPEIEDAEKIIAKYAAALKANKFVEQWEYEPTNDDDWSKLLWRLTLTCLEAGLTKEETFSVAWQSSVNKYKRDGRPQRYLWRDILKAFERFTNFEIIALQARFEMPDLIPGDKFKFSDSSFIDDYVAWGTIATDASKQYHELSAFIVLSSLLAGNLKLETSYGTVVPNLWGLILGDSTLTRKSTAMRMATDIIDFVDRDILLATDGSAEGILTGLSGRSGRTSMFFRDEVVGLFDSIRKKDYLAGIPQMFTQLYDGGYIARRLRKELITVTDPIFIFYGGGIKDQFFVSVDEQFVYSGFLPRFLIVTGETDLSRLRRVGPPTSEVVEHRQNIYTRLSEMYKSYVIMGDVEILGVQSRGVVHVNASMSQEGWNLYGEITERITESAYKSPNQGLALPTFERMGISLLKMAMLISASRQTPSDDGEIEVKVEDLRRAASYIQIWGNYTIEVLANVGQTVIGRILEKVLNYIKTNPGVTRSQVSRVMNLTKRQMQEIEETLQDRGQLAVSIHGRGRSYQALS